MYNFKNIYVFCDNSNKFFHFLRISSGDSVVLNLIYIQISHKVREEKLN